MSGRTGNRLAALLAAPLLVLGCATVPPTHDGGQDEVVLCHKGKTIVVAAPAVRAHLNHGDTRGPCGPGR